MVVTRMVIVRLSVMVSGTQLLYALGICLVIFGLGACLYQIMRGLDRDDDENMFL